MEANSQLCTSQVIAGSSANTTDGLNLSWRIELTKQKTAGIDYEIVNPSSVAIHVLDILFGRVGSDVFMIENDRMIADIYDSSQPELLDLILGYADPVSHSRFQWGPGSRTVMPGATIQGHVNLQYPFEIWHYNRSQHPRIFFVPSAIILKIGYLLDGSVAWTTRKLVDGGTMDTPAPGYAALNQRILASSIIKWPPCR